MSWFHSKKDSPNRRLLGWQLTLPEYDFEIKHRKGSKHANADGPSRLNTMLADVAYGEEVYLRCTSENMQIKESKDETKKNFETDFGCNISHVVSNNEHMI
jgi:hypothetical protein